MQLAAASARVTTVLVVLVGSATFARATEVAAPAPSSATPTNASPALLVRVRDGLLSVRSDGAPLVDVLHAVAAETDVEIAGEPSDRRHVWKRFEGVPLVAGLRRVIGRQNFTLTYDAHGAPLRLELLGAPEPPLSPDRKPAPEPPSFFALLQRAPPVTVSARVAATLGTARTIRLAQLAPAFRVDDPAVRRDAVDAFLSALRRNPPLRSTFVGLPDAQVAALAHGWARGRAADVLQTIAARTLYDDVRALARRAAARVAR